jgi:ribosomal protein S27E
MVTKCTYCGSTTVVVNRNEELICVECATVLGFAPPAPRKRRLSPREMLFVLLHRYI